MEINKITIEAIELGKYWQLFGQGSDKSEQCLAETSTLCKHFSYLIIISPSEQYHIFITFVPSKTNHDMFPHQSVSQTIAISLVSVRLYFVMQ